MAEGTRDYYDVLGVARSAGADDIQKAFRRLARTHHPDVNHEPGAEERFKELNEAYDVLSNPATRSRYDRFGPGFRQVPEGVDPEAWARAQRARRPGQGQTSRTRPSDPGFGTGADPDFDLGPDTSGTGFDDLLGGFVGGRGGRRRRGRGQGPTRGADQEAELVLPVEDAVAGGRRRITLSAGGSSGEERSIEVNIPPGVVTGQRVRVPGRGGAGTGDAPAGDLYLVIRLAPHARYRVEGRDLHVPLDLAPWEAALGTTVAVTTPTGETRVKVAAGTSSGRRLRLRGQGLPNPRGEPGDLFAEVRVVVPTELSPRERELFEALARESSFQPRPG